MGDLELTRGRVVAVVAFWILVPPFVAIGVVFGWPAAIISYMFAAWLMGSALGCLLIGGQL